MKGKLCPSRYYWYMLLKAHSLAVGGGIGDLDRPLYTIPTVVGISLLSLGAICGGRRERRLYLTTKKCCTVHATTMRQISNEKSYIAALLYFHFCDRAKSIVFSASPPGKAVCWPFPRRLCPRALYGRDDQHSCGLINSQQQSLSLSLSPTSNTTTGRARTK